MKHSRWNLLSRAPESYLADAPGFPLLITQLLYNRGLAEPSQVESFLAADERLQGDPFLLSDMPQAVARIYQALLSGENIAIYGDFDADGITATALLIQGLANLGGKVTPYIPHRLTEGYGLKTAALEKLYHQGVSLVISVDCGITAVSEVKRARRMGLDVIITDHHTPLELIPPATAIVDPKQTNSTYPFSELTGAGVAFKLLQALFQSIGKEKQLDGLVDLVAVGTVADVAPLLGENRYLVKQGLKLINSAPRLGIREMITQAGLNFGHLDAESISWVLAPRLNAAGRLAHAMTSYNLLMTDSPQEAQQLSIWLEQKNAERRRLTTRVLAKAREQVLAQGLSPLLIASHREFPPGVNGLVAGRLAEEFYRPAIVIKTSDEVSSGSCRSIPEFNIILALNQCRRLLTHFGGHSQAAGFTLPTNNLPPLQERLLQLATTQLEGVDLRTRLDIDAEVTLSALGGDTFQIMQRLAPFGRGNPVPTFLSRGVETIGCRTMGTNREHLRLKVKQDGTLWDAVGFGFGNDLAEVSPTIDIVYNLEIDQWSGAETLRLNIMDFAPANQNKSGNQ
ncbi:single-stranded-DNA-specific exonuclease RecJ [Chloroflexota bacterium]